MPVSAPVRDVAASHTRLTDAVLRHHGELVLIRTDANPDPQELRAKVERPFADRTVETQPMRDRNPRLVALQADLTALGVGVGAVAEVDGVQYRITDIEPRDTGLAVVSMRRYAP